MFRDLLCFVVLLAELAMLLRLVLGIFPLVADSTWGRIHSTSFQVTDPMVEKMRSILPPQPPGLPFPLAELVTLILLSVAAGFIC